MPKGRLPRRRAPLNSRESRNSGRLPRAPPPSVSADPEQPALRTGGPPSVAGCVATRAPCSLRLLRPPRIDIGRTSNSQPGGAAGTVAKRAGQLLRTVIIEEAVMATHAATSKGNNMLRHVLMIGVGAALLARC